MNCARNSMLLLPACLMFAMGCGSEGRMAIQGTVAVDGKPLSEGRISFTPTDGKRPQTSGSIKDGAYSITAAEGPMPGSCRVEVYSKRKTGKKVPTPGDPGVMMDEEKEMIPPDFNTASKLTVTFELNNHIYDFNLKK
ncbi:MAG: hypothetical protein U0744_17150 [Gemmataceae bacterium]